MILFNKFLISGKYDFPKFSSYIYEETSTGMLVNPKLVVSNTIFNNELKNFKNLILKTNKMHMQFINEEFTDENINFLKLVNYMNDFNIKSKFEIEIIVNFIKENNLTEQFLSITTNPNYKKTLKLFSYKHKRTKFLLLKRIIDEKKQYKSN